MILADFCPFPLLPTSSVRNMTFKGFKEPIPTFHYHSSIKIPAAGEKGEKFA